MTFPLIASLVANVGAFWAVVWLGARLIALKAENAALAGDKADLAERNQELEADADKWAEVAFAQEAKIREQGRALAELRAAMPKRGAGGKFAKANGAGKRPAAGV